MSTPVFAVPEPPAKADARPDPAARRRLPAAQRERQIVEAAAQFFAEHGLGGQTRELARGLGITHSAIFRYFPTKEALLDRVYEHVYVQRWNPAWGGLVGDRSQPLEARILRFYREYAEKIFDYVWVRIFVFSGLKGYDIAPRYLGIIRERVIHPICAEVRADLGLPSPDVVPLTEREIEAAWAMHGKVFYLAIRKFVYGWPIPQDLSQTIADDVSVFLDGAPRIFIESVASARTA
ncbi:TetR/AcrR family transcriptional regulator [Methylobacterium planeticum]|uniref:TetR/AcrR family transcriptional regulator n=1 Tax=Methylobacterium planeticum TaxID=2615211 RepID=A0A6N6MWR8_9HYPH|nr:TetR/AcrR family transcriptional regulator [Methylobacterium planeticum]KAB1073479.1 TetR/AcrR family transcriptional regulator [Methylobacterium planeticum]